MLDLLLVNRPNDQFYTPKNPFLAGKKGNILTFEKIQLSVVK